MNITYIIGNGFDLHLGLQTSYRNFLNWYLQQPANNNIIKKYKDELKTNVYSEWWKDAEIAMGKDVGNYTNLNIEEYYACLHDFKASLIEYLNSQLSECSYDEKTIATAFQDFLLNSFADAIEEPLYNVKPSSQADNRYDFITFNYTDTLDKIISITSKTFSLLESHINNNTNFTSVIGKTIHVHGTLSTYIIMGVNDIDQLNTKNVTTSDEMIWTLVKPQVNASLKSTQDSDAESLITNSDIILIFGSSFGDSDKKWWDLINKWIQSNETRKLFYFKRKEEGDALLLRGIPEDTLKFKSKQKKFVANKLGFNKDDDKYSKILERIHIVYNTQRLDFKLRDIYQNEDSIAAFSAKDEWHISMT